MRKILYALGVTCTLMLMLYGLNFFSNEVVNEKMLDNVFDRNDFAWLGFMEPWKEPYNLGTNYLKQRDYDSAIAQFDKALSYNIPDDSECEVRINKALAMTLPINEEDVDDRNLDTYVARLEEAEAVLLEKDFAREDGKGEYEDAQGLYDDIVEYKLHLLDITSTRFNLIKADADDGSIIPGAKMQITGVDKNGDPIKIEPADITLGEGASVDTKFTGEGILIVTGRTNTLVDKVFDGTYTIHEVEAPKGYDVAEDVTFEVIHCKVLKGDNEAIVERTDTEDAVITMKDALFRTDVNIRKVDTKKQDLEGAILTLTGVDVNGKKVVIPKESVILGEDAYFNEADSGEGVSFVTGKTMTTITGLVDGEYTLHEDKAPKGYTEAQDIKFVIENGAVVADNKYVTLATGPDLAVVTMTDEEDPEQQSGGGSGEGEGEGGGGGGQGEGEGGEGQEGQGGGGSGEGGGTDDGEGGGQGQDQVGGDNDKGADSQNEQEGEGGDPEDDLKNYLSDLQDQANQQRSDELGAEGDSSYFYSGDIW